MPAASTDQDECPLLDLNIVMWRFDVLDRAGYPTEQAVTLAERGDIDLHDAVELLRRGCSVEQAVRILL